MKLWLHKTQIFERKPSTMEWIQLWETTHRCWKIYLLGANPLVASGFSIKYEHTVDKFKARFVAQGFRQKHDVDHFDTYALIARITSIRLLVTIASSFNLVIHEIYVKTTFLYGDLEEAPWNNPNGLSWKDKNKRCASKWNLLMD